MAGRWVACTCLQRVVHGLLEELGVLQALARVEVELVGRAQVALAHLDFADEQLVEQGGVHDRVAHLCLGLGIALVRCVLCLCHAQAAGCGQGQKGVTPDHKGLGTQGGRAR
jgi:hypothetical protein